MMKWAREFRLLPVVLIGIGALFALKTIGLIFDGGYTLGQRLGGANGSLVVTTVPGVPTIEMQSPSRPLEMASSSQPSGPKLSWMQEVFNYPGGDITGSVAAKPKEPPKEEAKAGEQPKAEQSNAGQPKAGAPETKPAAVLGTVIPLEQSRPASAAERALLERLQERRQELEARARELDLRESLLKAAEKKLEVENVAEKAAEAKGGPPGQPGQRKEDSETARLKAVVTMYETMKAKDAAKIFDRLDIKVLLDMATHIKPQRMAEILAQMLPENAERLTMELAARGPVAVNPVNLPKIEGRPTGG